MLVAGHFSFDLKEGWQLDGGIDGGHLNFQQLQPR
jgi:hypothetical protein